MSFCLSISLTVLYNNTVNQFFSFIFYLWMNPLHWKHKQSKGAVTCRQVEISSRTEICLGYMSTSTRVENKNISTRAEIKNTICSMFYVMIYKWKPLLNKICEILKMKRQKNMEKIVLALSSALTTCSLLLQCYSVLALKIMRVR